MNKKRILTTAMLAIAAAATMVACSSSGGGSPGGNTPSTTPPAAAAAVPTGPAQTVTITPHSGLKNAQVVHVVGKGYQAGKIYIVTECADKGATTDAGDCNLDGRKTGTADATGTVTVSFPVVKRFG